MSRKPRYRYEHIRPEEDEQERIDEMEREGYEPLRWVTTSGHDYFLFRRLPWWRRLFA